ncbi:MAG: hypothetical protein AMXMBFR84_10920 [Candidatus Hydrogenedentota bacterium]
MIYRWTLLLACAFGFWATGSAAALELGKSPGAVAIETLDGLPRSMNNYGERAGTVVTFLSTRCEGTEQQFPIFNLLHEEYRLRDILFVGIVVNPEESGDEIRAFQQNKGCRFPVYRDPSGKSAAQFGATVTPEFFLIDGDGTLEYHGPVTGLEAAILGLLGEKELKTTPIGERGARKEIPNPYGTMAFSSELIFSIIPGAPVHHCSTIAEAPNGDLLCLWYGGSYESAEDQALFLSRLKKGERIWSKPESMLANQDQPPGNALILRGYGDEMIILWGRMESTRPLRRGSGWGQCRIMVRTSKDNGKTWSKDVEMPDGYAWLPRNAALTLSDGTIAVPLSGRVDGKYAGFLVTLNKDGSWSRLPGVMPGGEQPTVIQRDNGELLSLMRSEPRILQSVSTDAGQSWTMPERTELKCPDSGIAMTKLKSGRLVLVYNDTDQSDRTPLVLKQSTDGGLTWGEPKVLEADWGEFSYPCVIEDSDGMVHVTYTYRRYSIKHVAFDEGWLIHKERPN